MSYFDFGEYGFFIWSGYGIAGFSIAMMVFYSLRRVRLVKKELKLASKKPSEKDI